MSVLIARMEAISLQPDSIRGDGGFPAPFADRVAPQPLICRLCRHFLTGKRSEKIMLLGEHQPKQGDGEQQGQKDKPDDDQRPDSVQSHAASLPCQPAVTARSAANTGS